MFSDSVGACCMESSIRLTVRPRSQRKPWAWFSTIKKHSRTCAVVIAEDVFAAMFCPSWRTSANSVLSGSTLESGLPKPRLRGQKWTRSLPSSTRGDKEKVHGGQDSGFSRCAEFSCENEGVSRGREG